MPRIRSRYELKDYALRRLGAPVTQVNVEDSQAEDRIDDALQFFEEFHSDAVKNTYVKHQVTASDIEEGFITIIVAAVNDQPVAQDIEITLYEDNLFNFTFDVSDVDNTQTTYTTGTVGSRSNMVKILVQLYIKI